MKILRMTIILFMAFVFVGCQTNTQDDQQTGDRDPEVEQTRFKDEQTVDDRRTRHNDRGDRRDNREQRNDRDDQRHHGERYDVSKEAADQITSKIDEIDYAYVITNNRNAYVAAVLDNKHGKSRDSNMRDTNRSQMTNEMDGSQSKNNRDVDEGHELTDDVKKEIKDIVQSVDGDIDRVFVTTNPDFADLTNNYINDLNAGKPVRGMFDQMGNMIERLFPQNR